MHQNSADPKVFPEAKVRLYTAGDRAETKMRQGSGRSCRRFFKTQVSTGKNI